MLYDSVDTVALPATTPTNLIRHIDSVAEHRVAFNSERDQAARLFVRNPQWFFSTLPV